MAIETDKQECVVAHWEAGEELRDLVYWTFPVRDAAAVSGAKLSDV